MIHVAVIGFGFIGEMHLNVWNMLENAVITAICGRNQKVGSAMAAKYGCRFYTDIEKMLQEEKLDVIDICTPTFLHEEAILLAAKYHTHVICEKPVTLTLDSMELILKTVSESGILFMAAHVLRFWKEYRLIKELYEEGNFGTIHSVYAHRLAQYPPDSIWRHDPAQSGGGFFDLHIHDIDYMVHLFGEVKSVYSVGLKSENNCWDNVSTLIKFKNGLVATVEAVLGMTEGYPFSSSFRMVGSNQTLDFTLTGGVNVESLTEDSNRILLYDKSGCPKILTPKGPTDFEAELTYFASCIEQNKAPERISPNEVYYVLKVMLAIRESLDTGMIIEL